MPSLHAATGLAGYPQRSAAALWSLAPITHGLHPLQPLCPTAPQIQSPLPPIAPISSHPQTPYPLQPLFLLTHSPLSALITIPFSPSPLQLPTPYSPTALCPLQPAPPAPQPIPTCPAGLPAARPPGAGAALPGAALPDGPWPFLQRRQHPSTRQTPTRAVLSCPVPFRRSVLGGAALHGPPRPRSAPPAAPRGPGTLGRPGGGTGGKGSGEGARPARSATELEAQTEPPSADPQPKLPTTISSLYISSPLSLLPSLFHQPDRTTATPRINPSTQMSRDGLWCKVTTIICLHLSPLVSLGALAL